jgi:hypothetical protein
VNRPPPIPSVYTAHGEEKYIFTSDLFQRTRRKKERRGRCAAMRNEGDVRRRGFISTDPFSIHGGQPQFPPFQSCGPPAMIHGCTTWANNARGAGMLAHLARNTTNTPPRIVCARACVAFVGGRHGERQYGQKTGKGMMWHARKNTRSHPVPSRSRPERATEKTRYRPNPDSPVSPMIPASVPESTDPNDRLQSGGSGKAHRSHAA